MLGLTSGPNKEKISFGFDESSSLFCDILKTALNAFKSILCPGGSGTRDNIVSSAMFSYLHSVSNLARSSVQDIEDID